VYAREVKGQTLTFYVTGKLWGDSLVMGDKQTESSWSHLLGEAMAGPLVGEVLDSLPSLLTDWKTWKTKHPETTVLNMSRIHLHFRREMYRPRKERGHGREQFVIGLKHNGQSRAWGFEKLLHHPVINDKIGDLRLLVLYDDESKTASMFDRQLEGKVFTFDDKAGRLIDRETGSVWDRLHGRAVEGPQKGARLKPLSGLTSFKRAWKRFHPATTMWAESE